MLSQSPVKVAATWPHRHCCPGCTTFRDCARFDCEGAVFLPCAACSARIGG